jgi:phage major head subunit gpT-like protein
MALVKSDIGPLLKAGLQTQFFQTFAETPSMYDRVATIIHSDKDTEQYAWLGALPGVREFLDERQAQDMTPYSYAIKNKTWESTISVDRAALEDDLYGQIPLRIKQMAASAKQHLDILTFAMLSSGFSQNGYDAVPFFGTHNQGGPQINKSTDPLSAAALQTAITAMMRFTDDQGKPAGVNPDLLVVAPENHWEARVLLESTYFPDPLITASQLLAMNPLMGSLKLLSSPYLVSPNNWYLLDTKRIVKAIVLQLRKDFEFMALDDEETAFMRDELFYGVRARYNCGFGDWRGAFGAQVS